MKPISQSSNRVAPAEKRSEPRQPIRLEKKKNILGRRIGEQTGGSAEAKSRLIFVQRCRLFRR